MSYKYIDIHSHRENDDNQVFVIKNIPINSDKQIEISKFCSIGIHPWNISEIDDINRILLKQEEALQNSNILFIGECGLDKSIQSEYETQIEVFQNQLTLAEKYNKPIIIHCVKAYYDVISCIKKTNVHVSVIFHRYSGNKQTRDALLQYNTYFSFGAEIINQPKLLQIVADIPLSRLFLETDDKDIKIQEVYEIVAKVKNISIEELKKIICDNFNKIVPNLGSLLFI